MGACGKIGLLLALMWVSPLGWTLETHPNSIRVDYTGFSVWLDCDRHGLHKFSYSVGFDTGTEPRKDNFKLDTGISPNCQPTSASSFKAPAGALRFDRGHQVPANHMDWSAQAIAQTNYMTNILPQSATLNRGAWLATEEIIECLRDTHELQVIGGAIWGSNAGNDYFLQSHGIATPDRFWKVVIRDDGLAIAWLFPNNNAPSRANLDKYLVKPAKIEALTGESFAVTNRVRNSKPTKSWKIPKGCDKG